MHSLLEAVMKLITEAQVAACLNPVRVRESLRAAFLDLGAGRASVLARSRAGDPVAGMVSSMGAVLPSLDVLGTKVYATRNGRFEFLVNLFQLSTGLPLATLQANELTRLRTAACTALAVEALARPNARSLGIFGAGVQAQAHIEALWPLRAFTELRICARTGAEALAAQLRKSGLPASAVSADDAAQADVIATCTRSSTALFDGALVQAGAFVAAVGSSKPAARELDDTLLARATLLAVEWEPAASLEAGEFRQAAPGVIDAAKVVELGKLVQAPPQLGPEAIVVFKSVGIGLADVAVAHAVLQAA
jgi:ornithine cyclodeaminase